MNGRLLIFAKAPIPGQTKSRLIPALGAEGAAQLQAHFIRHTLAIATRLPIPIELWCSPDTHHPIFTATAQEFFASLHKQEGEDLGARMHHAFQSGMGRGGPVVVIGTDCPSLGEADLYDAFAALSNGYDAVVGPSVDGGYYLVGLRAAQPTLFGDIQWSTSSVLSETRVRMQAAGLRWHELRSQNDIDLPHDLIHLPPILKQVISL